MMWAEYFPTARIVGLDICLKKLKISPRVTVVQGSQDDLTLLSRLSGEYGPFDIVIDDGSHQVTHMTSTFFHLYPLLRSEGTYVVEDTQTSFMSNAGGNPTGSGSIFELAHRLSLAMHRKEGFSPNAIDSTIDRYAEITASVSVYRNMIAFHRGSNLYPSNLKFDMENPQVKVVYDEIGREYEQNPSGRNFLSRIDMAIWGGATVLAEKLAGEAVALHPNDPSLVRELYFMMMRTNRTEMKERLRLLMDNSGKLS
jgi:hypothetical protein